MRYMIVMGSAALLWLLLPGQAARAEMVLNKVIVQFEADGPRRDDIEVVNLDPNLLYLAVEPREVVDPGTEREQRISRPDPEALGLLVSPERSVVEAGARRLVRLSLLDRPQAVDRVWRVTFRPVVGPEEAPAGALRILAAYNVLVIAYPPEPRAEIVAERSGRNLILHNRGNSNALLFDGEQCAPGGGECRDLPTRRLYAGNSWRVTLHYDTPARWRQQTVNRITDERF